MCILCHLQAVRQHFLLLSLDWTIAVGFLSSTPTPGKPFQGNTTMFLYQSQDVADSFELTGLEEQELLLFSFFYLSWCKVHMG